MESKDYIFEMFYFSFILPNDEIKATAIMDLLRLSVSL